MVELELEKTYLAKHLPPGLEGYPHSEIVDLYIPGDIAPIMERLGYNKVRSQS